MKNSVYSNRGRLGVVAGLAIGAMAIVGCGGDDEASGPQGELADVVVGMVAEFAELDGFEWDEDCVREIVNGLSDADAEAGLAALQDPDGDSSAFDATGEQIEAECFSL